MWEITNKLWDLIFNLAIISGCVGAIIISLMISVVCVFIACLWCEDEIKKALYKRFKR